MNDLRFKIHDSRMTPIRVIFLCAAFAFVLLIIFGKMTHAFLSDSATTTNNTFSAASEFPSTGIGSTSPPSQTVVINEIMWMGSHGHGGSDEWVELRNMTGGIVDISNWSIDNLGTGTPGTIMLGVGSTIPAGGFFVIANDSELDSMLNFEPDFQAPSVSLNNGGEQLILKNSSSATIDTANGSEAWFAGDNGTARRSMERNLTPGDGTVSSNWHTATTQANLDPTATESATPKAVNSL